MPGNKAFNIDDIGNVNSFLALIGGSQVSSPPGSERTTVSASRRSPVAEPSGLAAAGNDVLVSLQHVLTLFVEVILLIRSRSKIGPYQIVTLS